MSRRARLALWGWLALALALAGAAWALRCRAPVREVERTETRTAAQVEAAAERTEVVEARRATVTRREVRREERRPDGGTVTETAVEVERTDAAGSVASAEVARSEAVLVEEARREVVRERVPDWRVRASAGWDVADLRLQPSEVTAEVERRAVGPVWAGAWLRAEVDDLAEGRLRGAAGVSLSVEW